MTPHEHAARWKALAKRLWREQLDPEDYVHVSHICPNCDHWGWIRDDWGKAAMSDKVHCAECGYHWELKGETE